jgi:hypothetical protein
MLTIINYQINRFYCKEEILIQIFDRLIFLEKNENIINRREMIQLRFMKDY